MGSLQSETSIFSDTQKDLLPCQSDLALRSIKAFKYLVPGFELIHEHFDLICHYAEESYPNIQATPQTTSSCCNL